MIGRPPRFAGHGSAGFLVAPEQLPGAKLGGMLVVATDGSWTARLPTTPVGSG